MAANTVGYILESASGLDQTEGDSPASQNFDPERIEAACGYASEVVFTACKIALLCAIERRESDVARNVDPYRHLWGAARFLLLPKDADGKIVPRDAPDFGALDAVVKWLVRDDRPVREHEACAILVTAITVLECLDSNDGAFKEEKFAELVYGEWIALEAAAHSLVNTTKGSLISYIDDMLYYLLERIASNWKDAYAGASIQRSYASVRRDGNDRSKRFISALAKAALERSILVFRVFKAAFLSLTDGDKRSWLHDASRKFDESGAEPMFGRISVLVSKYLKQFREFLTVSEDYRITLDKLVLIPENWGGSSHSGSLQRYLVGCDILGAEHLQYPENILLAACDITRQNAEDNVVYSEIRCATNGYGRGGMNVIDATDLLCKGFDLGAIFFGSGGQGKRFSSSEEYAGKQLLEMCPGNPGRQLYEAKRRWDTPQRRWIRSNILLGAKRHRARKSPKSYVWSLTTWSGDRSVCTR